MRTFLFFMAAFLSFSISAQPAPKLNEKALRAAFESGGIVLTDDKLEKRSHTGGAERVLAAIDENDLFLGDALAEITGIARGREHSGEGVIGQDLKQFPSHRLLGVLHTGLEKLRQKIIARAFGKRVNGVGEYRGAGTASLVGKQQTKAIERCVRD